MKTTTVYRELALIIDALARCKKKSVLNPWISRHEDTIDNLANNYLPHGSGVDCGTKVNLSKSNGNKLVFNASFHAMDDNGYYDGWIEYVVTVIPSFIHEIELDIRGNFGKRQDIKEMLYNIYRYALVAGITVDYDPDTEATTIKPVQ